MRARILLITALLAGCTTRQKVAGGGVGLAIVGLTLTYSDKARTEEEVGTEGKVGIALLLTGLATLFIAAALEENARKEAPKQVKVTRVTGEPPPEQAAAIRAQLKRDQAWALTKQAQEAARAPDCAKVTELSAQVGALDAEFFADVFMKDIAVQRCFVPADPQPAPAP